MTNGKSRNPNRNYKPAPKKVPIKKRVIKKKPTKDKLGTVQIKSPPKKADKLSKDNIKWLKKCEEMGFSLWWKPEKHKKTKQRCMYNKTGDNDNPEQCKARSFKGSIFCQSHGGQRKFQAVKRMQELGIYQTSGALVEEIKALEFIDKASFENVDDEIKLQIANIRNFLNKTNDVELARIGSGRLRLMCETLVETKKKGHEMKYGKSVSFSLETLNWILLKIFSIISRNVADVEAIKSIQKKIETLGIEIQKRDSMPQ